MKLFRVGDTTWYVLVDVEKKVIVAQYEKSATQATATQIQSQLANYPDPTQIETDVQSLIWLVNNYAGASAAQKTRVKQLIADMYQAYQGEPLLVERATLRARLDELNKLLAEMV